jgi:hypothetical protein
MCPEIPGLVLVSARTVESCEECVRTAEAELEAHRSAAGGRQARAKQVLHRDGSISRYDPAELWEKLAGRGLSTNLARRVVEDVSEWIGRIPDDVVTSEMLAAELRLRLAYLVLDGENGSSSAHVEPAGEVSAAPARHASQQPSHPPEAAAEPTQQRANKSSVADPAREEASASTPAPPTASTPPETLVSAAQTGAGATVAQPAADHSPVKQDAQLSTTYATLRLLGPSRVEKSTAGGRPADTPTGEIVPLAIEGPTLVVRQRWQHFAIDVQRDLLSDAVSILDASIRAIEEAADESVAETLRELIRVLEVLADGVRYERDVRWTFDVGVAPGTKSEAVELHVLHGELITTGIRAARDAHPIQCRCSLESVVHLLGDRPALLLRHVAREQAGVLPLAARGAVRLPSGNYPVTLTVKTSVDVQGVAPDVRVAVDAVRNALRTLVRLEAVSAKAARAAFGDAALAESAAARRTRRFMKAAVRSSVLMQLREDAAVRLRKLSDLLGGLDGGVEIDMSTLVLSLYDLP